jgi:hypothetical protein
MSASLNVTASTIKRGHTSRADVCHRWKLPDRLVRTALRAPGDRVIACVWSEGSSMSALLPYDAADNANPIDRD